MTLQLSIFGVWFFQSHDISIFVFMCFQVIRICIHLAWGAHGFDSVGCFVNLSAVTFAVVNLVLVESSFESHSSDSGWSIESTIFIQCATHLLLGSSTEAMLQNAMNCWNKRSKRMCWLAKQWDSENPRLVKKLLKMPIHESKNAICKKEGQMPFWQFKLKLIVFFFFLIHWNCMQTSTWWNAEIPLKDDAVKPTPWNDLKWSKKRETEKAEVKCMNMKHVKPFNHGLKAGHTHAWRERCTFFD